jgi:26S proteasome regulatory subunit N10
MRDGDFIPTRMQAQQDAVSLIFHAKTRSNPENNVGLLTLSEYESLFEKFVFLINFLLVVELLLN